MAESHRAESEFWTGLIPRSLLSKWRKTRIDFKAGRLIGLFVLILFAVPSISVPSDIRYLFHMEFHRSAHADPDVFGCFDPWVVHRKLATSIGTDVAVRDGAKLAILNGDEAAELFLVG